MNDGSEIALDDDSKEARLARVGKVALEFYDQKKISPVKSFVALDVITEWLEWLEEE